MRKETGEGGTYHRRRAATGSGLVSVSLLKGGAVAFGTGDVAFGAGLFTLGKFCLRTGSAVWFGEGVGNSPTYESWNISIWAPSRKL